MIFGRPQTSDRAALTAGRERNLRLAINASAQLAAKFSVGVSGLISVPIILGCLGQDRYGIWITITSILALSSWMDLGLSNGLLNKLTLAFATGNQIDAKRAFSTAFIILSIVAVSVTVIILTVGNLANIGSLLGVGEHHLDETNRAISVLLVLFAVGLPLGVVDRARIALQENWIVSLIQAASSIISLYVYYILAQSKVTLWYLAAAMLMPVVTLTAINGLLLLSYQNKWLRPSIKNFERREAKDLVETGGKFFILQLLSAFIFSIDPFIVANTQSLAAVTQFSVHARCFMLIQVILMAVVNPLWAAFGAALARGEKQWVKDTFRNVAIFVILIGVLTAVCMVIWGPYLVNLWIGDAVIVSRPLMLALSCWTVLNVLGALSATLLNAAGKLAIQIKVCVVLLPLIVFSKYYSSYYFGSVGLVIAGSFCYLVVAAIPMAIASKKIVT